MLSGPGTGATGIPCADVVTAKAKAAKAINLIISVLPYVAEFLAKVGDALEAAYCGGNSKPPRLRRKK
jgi:hypothetical protein